MRLPSGCSPLTWWIGQLLHGRINLKLIPGNFLPIKPRWSLFTSCSRLISNLRMTLFHIQFDSFKDFTYLSFFNLIELPSIEILPSKPKVQINFHHHGYSFTTFHPHGSTQLTTVHPHRLLSHTHSTTVHSHQLLSLIPSQYLFH